jgi:hypothetical protein
MAATAVEASPGVFSEAIPSLPSRAKSQAMESVEDILYGSVCSLPPFAVHQVSPSL